MTFASRGSFLRQSALHQLSPSFRRTPFRQVLLNRGFAATATRNGSVAEVLVSFPTAVLDVVHAASIPWYASIPITAAVVRGVFCYYVSDRPSRLATIKRQVVVPLVVDSSRPGVEAEAIRLPTGNDEAEKQKLLRPVQVFARYFRGFAALNKYGKAIGVPLFRIRSFTNIATLWAFMEAIRYKCGINSGILTLLTKPFQNILDLGPFQEASAELLHTLGKTQDELTAERLEAIIVAKQDAVLNNSETMLDELRNHSSTPSHAIDSATSAFTDITLQTEGLPWCLDLTLPDPFFILPAMLGVTMAANALFRHIRQVDDPAKFGTSERLRLSVAWLFFFISGRIPAGILLYWISHLVTGWVQSRWLDIRHPLPKPTLPCKRQLRRKIDTQWLRT